MIARILDGKRRAVQIMRALKRQVNSLKASYKQVPGLVAIQIGDNSASSVYIKSQVKIAESVGIGYKLIKIDTAACRDELISTIKSLNADTDVSAVIVQRPLPLKLSPDNIYSFLSPLKDAEGLCAENMGRLFYKNSIIMPPTVSAIIELLKLSKVKLYGKETVIVGHSEIIGKPLSMALLNEFATVSVCHIATSEKKKLKSHIGRAEVLVAAVGKPNLIKGEWIRKGAVVIDVGINKVGDKIVGDVEFVPAKKRASYISPVPGGVGPLTTVMLMRNCVELFKLQRRMR